MDGPSTPLGCACGKVRGRLLHDKPVPSVACMCKWCQAYAHHLGREQEMLDQHGGSCVYQVSPPQLRIDEGAEHIRCLRLSKKGALRWYAGCCKSAIANALDNPRMPWLGLLHTFIDAKEPIGPVRYRVNAGERAAQIEGAHKTGSIGLVLWAIGRTVRNALRGRGRPTPFYDAQGEPIAEAKPVTREARVDLGLSKA